MTVVEFEVIGDPAPHIRRHIEVNPSGCWLWTASKSRDGYGWTSLNGKTYQAHRLVYIMLVGPVPDGMVLDHLCRVRHCVNPAHLEPVTTAENLRRSPLTPAGQDRCRKGHELSEYRGQRRCLVCLAEYEEGRREAKRLAERERRARLRRAS